MAREHQRELIEFGEAYLRWAACVEAAAPEGGDEEEALSDAVWEAASRYVPIAEAASTGTDEEEDRAWDKALWDYRWLVVEQAVSRGAGAVAIVVATFVILRLWTGSPPGENLGAAVASVSWWGVPAVVAGGVVWGMRHLRIDGERWRTVIAAPRNRREGLLRFLRDSIGCTLASPFSHAALAIWVGVFILEPANMTGYVVGALGAHFIPWGRMWRAVRRELARPV